MRETRLRAGTALLAATIALSISGCASPSVEQTNAANAKISADCEAKGYKAGTPDFHTCQSLAIQKTQQDNIIAVAPLVMISDVRAKRDLRPIGHLENGLTLYRFRYNWGEQFYVGVVAQEVLTVDPAAVERGSDGYLRVNYARVGAPFMTWERWVAIGPTR